MTMTMTKNLTRRALARSAITAAALLSLGNAPALAQQGPGVTDKEIKLGTWIPLTGPFAAYGVPYRAGLDAYINMVNDKGGIKGRKITLVVEDNAYNPQRTVAAARKLISRDEVLAIAMPFGNVSASAFDYVLSEAKVPMVNPWGSSLDWYT
ncbi:MAG: ABC transporter substrate-binding protein, partial [Frankiaceae bacterium]|nr:ABC transporter substrate-binding protein [Arenimonas sp.]